VTASDLATWTRSYKHLSSITFNTGRMPLAVGFGVGAPASDPSPRNNGPSGIWVNCAASRTLVKDQ